jgi:uncharacterized membrane protein
MSMLLLAISVFIAAHVVPALPGVRPRLIGWLGRRVYLAVYSVVSLVLFAWVIEAAVTAETVELWAPAPWQAIVPLVATPIAAVLLAAGLASPNPLSITLRKGDEPGAVTRITRHPVPWAFLLWAASHIPPNGTLTALLFFGTMGAFALLGMKLIDRKAIKAYGRVRWDGLASRAPLLPSVSGAREAAPGLLWPGLLGLAVWLWFLLDGHQRLIGLDPLGYLR